MASGTHFGNTLTLTLTRSVPCTAVMLAFPIAFKDASADPETFTSCQSVIDSHGHSWTLLTSSLCVIGSMAQIIPGGPPYTRLIFGPGAIRSVVPGDLVAGDTVAFTWNATTPADFTNGAMIFAFTGIKAQANLQTRFAGDTPAIYYDDGDGYPETGLSNNTLSWSTDLGNTPAPEAMSTAIAVAARSPAGSGYVAAAGQVLGELGGAGWTMAVSCEPLVGRGTTYEPGGAWPGTADILLGNYQFADLETP